jgi:hypothetical protein
MEALKMGLITLVYVSFATNPLNDEELKKILAVARKNNQEAGITGMLLYRDGFFMQVLEGDEAVVNAKYNRIAEDPRHRGVMKVYSHPIEERSFSKWSMGFNTLRDSAPEGLEGYTDFLANPNQAFFTDEPTRAKILLLSFRLGTYF